MKRYICSVLSLVVLALAACSSGSGQTERGSTARASTSGATVRSGNRIVATVGHRKIALGELEDRVRGDLVRIDTERYETLKQGLDDMISEELLDREAKGRHLSRAELEKQEIDDKVKKVTAEEVEKFYNDNKDRLRGQSLEQLRSRIEQYLNRQRLASRRQQFLNELRAKTPVHINLEPPRVKVSVDDDPSRGGPAEAPVTIVEFSDFQCPFCRRAEATVKRILDEYGDKVRLVYRDYPLPMHSNAHRAAEAAECAQDQGKYWKYHDLLFENQRALDEKSLIAYAKQVGMDEKTFAECLKSGKHRSEVDKDIEDGNRAGVSGTPSFFINGRPLSGAVPFAQFKEVIDAELAAAKAARR